LDQLARNEAAPMNPSRQFRVFVLMPFAPKFDCLLEEIKLAAADANAKAERVDEQFHEQDILNQIITQIEQSDAIVAVMTGKSPNVFYEVGIAHALKKHVLLLTNDANDIPFDLKHCKHVTYKNSTRKRGAIQESDALKKKITSELDWILSNPRVSDSYYQEYKNAMVEMESVSCALAQYLTPIARRCFSEWVAEIKELVTNGIDITGPERLEVTRLLVHATHKYRVVERMSGDPALMHSKDWISFIDEIARDRDVEKKWILCVEEREVKDKISDVEATWRFRKERNFETRYCSPVELERARGQKPPPYQAIEDFGQFVKLLSIPTGSYASGDKANILRTTFKSVEPAHARLMSSFLACSTEMNEQWVASLRDSITIAAGSTR
jgi:nucleoside 2-deoxyribosyltransferase